MSDKDHEFEDDLDLDETYLDDLDEGDENEGRTMSAKFEDEDEEFFDDEENRIGFDDYEDSLDDELDEEIDDLGDEEDEEFDDFDEEDDY